MHPIKAEKERLSMTYEMMAAIFQERTGKKIHPGLLATYVSGAKTPSRKTADLIQQAFPRIKRDTLLYPPAKTESAA